MTLRDEIEDAFLEALEQGANPPRYFSASIPSAAFTRVAREGATVIRVAGFVMTLLADEDK